MFELGPEKIMVLLAVAVIMLGPKELPTIARTLGTALRQVRSLQDTLRAELERALNPGAEPPRAAPTGDFQPGDPAAGDSFQ